MLRWLLIALVIAAGAAFLTRPTETDVEVRVQEMLRAEIADGSTPDTDDPAVRLLFAACQSNLDACAELARAMMTVRYEDRRLYARVDAEGFGKTATCYAAYTRLYCPDGLQD